MRKLTYQQEAEIMARRHEEFMRRHGHQFATVLRADAPAPGAPIPQVVVIDPQKLAEAASWADQMREQLCAVEAEVA